MVLIRVVSFKGQPLPRGLSARFDKSGGTIGRGEHNTLVLADPERHISETHATVAFQAGGFVITDNGKNPTLLNGRPLGPGSQGHLVSGDRIKLGDYVLEVMLTGAEVFTPYAPPAAKPEPPASEATPLGAGADRWS